MQSIRNALAAAAIILLATPGFAQRSPERRDSQTTETRRNDGGATSRGNRSQSARTDGNRQTRNVQNQRPSARETACSRRYSSYDRRTNTFSPGRGKPRQRCRL